MIWLDDEVWVNDSDLSRGLSTAYEWDIAYDKQLPFCGAIDEPERVVCPLWPGHDGPHVRCAYALFEHQHPRITGCRTRRRSA